MGRRSSSGRGIRKPLNERFPDVVKAVAKLSIKSCILDGEVCALNTEGRSSFQLLQNQGETNHPVVYYVFDLLFAKARRTCGKLSVARAQNAA